MGKKRTNKKTNRAKRNKLKKRTASTRRSANSEKYLSWHFWFLHLLVLVAALFGQATAPDGEMGIDRFLWFGALVYASPFFLACIRNMMPYHTMKKFYVSSK